MDPQWKPPTLPTTTGETVVSTDYFDAIKEVKDAARAGNLTLLYVYNSADGAKVKRFEAIFKNETVAIAMKLFRNLKLDIASDNVAKSMYAGKVPTFLTFNEKGQRVAEVRLKDYKTKTAPLMAVLARTARGHGQMSLNTFVKKYRSFLNELDQVEGKKAACTAKKARVARSGSRVKLQKVQKEEKLLAAKEQKLLAKEKKLLAAVQAYDPKAPAKKAIAAVGSGSSNRTSAGGASGGT